jgi:hypothetical protein
MENEGNALPEGPDLARLNKENVQLRGANRLLSEEILELENSKDKRPCEVRQFMEATIAPPPAARRTTTKVTGIIIKPIVLPRNTSKS